MINMQNQYYQFAKSNQTFWRIHVITLQNEYVLLDMTIDHSWTSIYIYSTWTLALFEIAVEAPHKYWKLLNISVLSYPLKSLNFKGRIFCFLISHPRTNLDNLYYIGIYFLHPYWPEIRYFIQHIIHKWEVNYHLVIKVNCQWWWWQHKHS